MSDRPDPLYPSTLFFQRGPAMISVFLTSVALDFGIYLRELEIEFLELHPRGSREGQTPRGHRPLVVQRS